MYTSAGAGMHRHSLPADLSPMLGRETEMDQLMGLLDEPSKRLVTLTGTGGVGKTRLALHVTTTLVREFDRDVIFVPLAPIRDPDLVPTTINQALGPTPDGGGSASDQVVEALRESLALLVLDNFEHLLEAAPAVGELLAQCPRITILATSQAPLGIAGEQLYPLAPLRTPSPGQTTAESILRSDAVALFTDRARSVNPNMVMDDQAAVTIAEICRQLDGLPLAIELAAARTNILSPKALLARLSNRLQVLSGDRRDVPDRLRTMRHAIAWSYDLLTAPEQQLFRRLSVFTGGFPLDAIEAILEPAAGNRDPYAVLGTLVDHSLVQTILHPSGENRFLVLETLRDYGLERLDEAGETGDARLAHATWCLDLAEEAKPALQGGDQEAWLIRLDSEWDNIRAAGEWSLQHGHGKVVLRTFGALQHFSRSRGHAGETRAFLERALAATADEGSMFRSRGLVAAGNLALDQRDLQVAQALFEEALNLAISINESHDEIQALIGLAKVAVNRSDYVTASDFHQRAADLARMTGDQRAAGIALGGLAYVAYFQGRIGDAEGYWEEARQVVAAVGDILLEAVAASNLGAVARERGDYETAERLLTRVLELQRRMQASDSLPYTLTNLAETWRHLGDYTLAEDLLSEAVARFRELGYKGSEGTCLTSYAQLAFDRGDHARAALMLVESTRLIHEAGDQFPITENAVILAEICATRGTCETAIELMAAAAAIRNGIGAEPKPEELDRIQTAEAALRQVVAPAEFERHWQVGARYGLDALVRRITIVAREVAGAQQPPPLFPELDTHPPIHNLTNRELEILGLLAQGLSTQEIAGSLFISPRTATTHINNIFGKLEVRSRSAAVAFAMRNGLV